jgi:DNA polymerase III subunit delta
MTFEQIMAELRQGRYRPVYFLQGEEPFFIDQISDFIQDNALSEADRSFNQTVMYGLDSDIGTVISEAKRFPMMAERQVVILKEAQRLKTLLPAEAPPKVVKKGEEVKEPKGDMLAYCEKPQPTTVLVICHKYKKLDARKKKAKEILAAIEKNGGVVFTSEKVKDWKVADWIRDHVTAQGYVIDPRTSALLAEYLGNDLGKISNELGKLYISMVKGGKVTPELIEQNIGISKDYNIFELQNAIINRDVLKANRIVTYFAQNAKEHPLQMVMPVLHGFFFKMSLLHYAKRAKDRPDPGRLLGVPPFLMKDYQQGAANYPESKIHAILSHLRDVDVRSKGVDNVSADYNDLIRELVFKIMH